MALKDQFGRPVRPICTYLRLAATLIDAEHVLYDLGVLQLFRTIEVGLACAACIKRNVACGHKLHLLPYVYARHVLVCI